MRAPLVAPELGHHREREGRVADEDDEERGGSGLDHELQPDEEGEPDDRRPAAEARRVVGGLPAPDVQPAQERGAQVVEGRERVEEVPGRPDDGGDDGQPDPAVDPQEERRDVAVARPAGDPLGDDPGPADEPDGAEPVPKPRRRQRPRRVGDRWGGPDVADDDERRTRVRPSSPRRRGRPRAAAGSCRSRSACGRRPVAGRKKARPTARPSAPLTRAARRPSPPRITSGRAGGCVGSGGRRRRPPGRSARR